MKVIPVPIIMRGSIKKDVAASNAQTWGEADPTERPYFEKEVRIKDSSNILGP